MESVDLEVLTTSARWLADGQRVLMATVVRTWGSSPRPEGAMLAIRGDGLIVGSVSGGCIEDDLIERMRRGELDMSRPSVARYGVGAQEAHRFGPPCGGTLVGSRTPPEIAVSILAEVTAAKNGVSLPMMLKVEGAKERARTTV